MLDAGLPACEEGNTPQQFSARILHDDAWRQFLDETRRGVEVSSSPTNQLRFRHAGKMRFRKAQLSQAYQPIGCFDIAVSSILSIIRPCHLANAIGAQIG